jgi:hypothetical protein
VIRPNSFGVQVAGENENLDDGVDVEDKSVVVWFDSSEFMMDEG